MFERTVTEADLARLKAEREDADRRYQDALGALDAAIHAIEEFPHPPPAPDEFQITPLNEGWQIIGNEAQSSPGWRGRLAGLVWRVVAPLFQKQQAFNASVVDHTNRSLLVQRETQKAIASVMELQRYAMTAVPLHIMSLLQRLTPYIDTKDLEETGLMRRINEDTNQIVDLIDNHRIVILDQRIASLDSRIVNLDHRAVGLAGAINGVGDELLKRWQSMAAREERYESRVSVLTARHDEAAGETRAALSSLQQLTSVLKREFERTLAAGGAAPAAARAATPSPATDAAAASSMADTLSSSTLDAYKYVGFEDLFRGSQEDIRGRVAEYLPDFQGADSVLDVGCGRGEFLDLLREHGITARGLDINHEMVEVCRAQGLDAVEGDALGYLTSLADESLGGLFAAQVIEHLQPDYLLRTLETAYHKLRPGSRIVLETINPACWFAFFQSYIRDITHVRPLHPDTMKYLLVASGFRSVSIRYRAPYPEHEKLQPLPRPAKPAEGPEEDRRLALVDTFNENVEKINRLLFTYLDYAVIGSK